MLHPTTESAAARSTPRAPLPLFRRAVREAVTAYATPSKRDPEASATGLAERAQQPLRAILRIAQLALQRAGAGARDAVLAGLRHDGDRPLESPHGSSETSQRQRAIRRADCVIEEAADALLSGTDRCWKQLVGAGDGAHTPARARDAGEARSRRRHATSTGYAAVDGARIARCI